MCFYSVLLCGLHETLTLLDLWPCLISCSSITCHTKMPHISGLIRSLSFQGSNIGDYIRWRDWSSLSQCNPWAGLLAQQWSLMGTMLQNLTWPYVYSCVLKKQERSLHGWTSQAELRQSANRVESEKAQHLFQYTPKENEGRWQREVKQGQKCTF